MALPLHERAHSDADDALVRLTVQNEPELFRFDDLGKTFEPTHVVNSLTPSRPLEAGENYRFHFDMTKCIGCRSCEIACNEQNNNPADIRWRRVGEIEGGEYPDTLRHYLSMGCNHCLDADCVRGCPVEAYTKDPVTGIVLHSADACIGCQYCVWNCPYSVPQFNADRGVVGKCDMCHGRLADGLEPACVNACPEAAIEIEIVDIAAWKKDYAAAESPGMPAPSITISTTRITLPKSGPIELEKVDESRVRPEHAHLSLVLMTTLIQAVAGAVAYGVVLNQTSPIALLVLLAVTAFTLQISVFHLGRPAYAYRAAKMWRRSWLSREVLLFGLFFGSLAALTAAAWIAPVTLFAPTLHVLAVPRFLFAMIQAATIFFGGAGIIASACIYLIPARPSWNMVHTPVDFILSAALLGVPLVFVLERLSALLRNLPIVARFVAATPVLIAPYAGVLGAGLATALLLNLAIKVHRLKRSAIFEGQASYRLLRTRSLQTALIAGLVCILVAGSLALLHQFPACLLFATAGVLLARYLFFVSVVPLNMALTYVRRQAA